MARWHRSPQGCPVIDELGIRLAAVAGMQTVLRAETTGADLALDLNCPAPYLGVDAAYVTNGDVSRRALKHGSDGDLWSIMYNVIDSRPGATNIFKVNSHWDEKGPKAIQERAIRLDHMIKGLWRIWFQLR